MIFKKLVNYTFKLIVSHRQLYKNSGVIQTLKVFSLKDDYHIFHISKFRGKKKKKTKQNRTKQKR